MMPGRVPHCVSVTWRFSCSGPAIWPLLRTVQISAISLPLDHELDNLRSAITWALGKGDQQGAEEALGILIVSGLFWAVRSLLLENFPVFSNH